MIYILSQVSYDYYRFDNIWLGSNNPVKLIKFAEDQGLGIPIILLYEGEMSEIDYETYEDKEISHWLISKLEVI